MENGVFNYDLFHVRCKKLGELWFTNQKVVLSHFDPLEFNSALAM